MSSPVARVTTPERSAALRSRLQHGPTLGEIVGTLRAMTRTGPWTAGRGHDRVEWLIELLNGLDPDTVLDGPLLVLHPGQKVVEDVRWVGLDRVGDDLIVVVSGRVVASNPQETTP